VAITNGYATLAEAKARLGIPLADSQDDSVLEAIVEAASRSIDRHTGRRFYQVSSSARYFTAANAVSVLVDDFISLSAVATDLNLDRTWSNSISLADLEAAPLNAPAYGEPYTAIRVKPLAAQSLELEADAVKVTAVWGWSAIPDAINEATLLLTSRLFRRKDAPFGVAGGGEVGTMVSIRASDPDIRALIDPYRRLGVTDLV
jgi:hypothetical protein